MVLRGEKRSICILMEQNKHFVRVRRLSSPGAWELITGREKDFRFERSYGCGILASSRNLLAFRSATIGYRGLDPGTETENYGGIRPGCWINTIPAGGLLLVPEASNKCVCSYLIKATIALQPKR